MKEVLLLMANGFEALEASAFTDVLGWSMEFGIEKVNVTTAALRPEIRCTWNFIVKPQLQLREVQVDSYDALAVPGGFEKAGFYEDAYHEDFLDAIRRFHDRRKIVASVCVGALALGKSGILRGRKATTYALLGGKRRKQLAEFGADVIDQPVVVDDNIITSTGPATAPEVAFRLLEMLTSPANADRIRNYMGFGKPSDVKR
jgi:4-methyl-5(b-hydroxyethyl)-thiazole monophosphate biosynthesis